MQRQFGDFWVRRFNLGAEAFAYYVDGLVIGTSFCPYGDFKTDSLHRRVNRIERRLNITLPGDGNQFVPASGLLIQHLDSEDSITASQMPAIRLVRQLSTSHNVQYVYRLS